MGKERFTQNERKIIKIMYDLKKEQDFQKRFKKKSKIAVIQSPTAKVKRKVKKFIEREKEKEEYKKFCNSEKKKEITHKINNMIDIRILLKQFGEQDRINKTKGKDTYLQKGLYHSLKRMEKKGLISIKRDKNKKYEGIKITPSGNFAYFYSTF